MSGDPERPLVDAEARRLAVETFDRPLLVEAGAGTGKTTLLVERIAQALRRDVLRMPALVAITFTEKAAAELRLRLRQRLEAAAKEPGYSDTERSRLRRGLTELDRATVSTIHAFAAGLLRECPVQARVDPQFRMLDELESAQLFREFWKRWVDAELEQESAAARLRTALLCGVRLDPNLYALAREMDLQRDVVDAITPPRAVADVAEQVGRLRDAARAVLEDALQHCHDPADLGLLNVREVTGYFEALEALDPSGWGGFLLQAPKVKPSAGRAGSWAPGRAKVNKELRTALRAELQTVLQALADTVLHGVLAWLDGFRLAYDAEQRRRGVLDFQDLLLLARRLVHEDLAARRDLGARIGMLCVDEFQDTDPLQAELVLYLSETGVPAARWQDVEVGAKLFLVGDPKQSIYRFRRADLEVYEQCAERVLASGGLRLDIVRNFRSRPAVLDWANGVFASLFAPRADGVAAPRHVPLAGGEDTLPVPALWILHGGGDTSGDPVDADAARRREAEALAAWIHRALNDRWLVRDHAAQRPLRPRDIALLFGRTSGIETYETALRDAGLPFQQEGGRLFFKRQEVRDVLHALAAVDDPHDELAIVTVLRSPLFGVTDEELWLHRAAHGGFSYADPAAGRSPLAAQLLILATLHARRHARGVAETIAALLDATGARARFATLPQAAQVAANIDMLQRRARQFEAAHPSGLREFVRALHDLDRDAPRIAEWAPQDESDDRVRLLTVHMSKGLEFPCVLLANAGAKASNQTPDVLVDRRAGTSAVRLHAREVKHAFKTSNWEAIVQREHERDDAEECRLLYVAATRARDYLVIPGFDTAKPQGFMRWLTEVPGALGTAACGVLPPAVAADRGIPPGVAWCRVDAADLPRPARSRPPLPSRVDLQSLRAERGAWAVRHAAVLQRGGAMAAPEPGFAPAGAGSDPAAAPARWRELVARMLAGDDRREADVARARSLAAAAGAAPFTADLVRFVHAVRDFEAALAAPRTWRGRRLHLWDGAGLAEVWIDSLHQQPDGILLVDYVFQTENPARVEILAAKVRGARRAGIDVTAAGRLCVADGNWLPRL